MSRDNQNNYFLGASLPLQGLGGGSWLWLTPPTSWAVN